LSGSSLGKTYVEACDALFDFYTESLPAVLAFMKKKYPKPPQTPDALYESITKARVCDVLRYALPASTYTSIGMTGNARVLEHMISKLLSHPLPEMQDIGGKLKDEARKIIPTLVKYADRNAYMAGMDAAMEKLSVMRGGRKKKGGRLVTLVSYDRDAEDRVLSSVIYRYSDMPHKEALQLVRSLGRAKNTALIESLFAGRGKFDSVPRELENAYYTFDVLVDYGAFRDIQRHRMCTQVNQDVTTAHGYDVPQELKEAGLDGKFRELMEKAEVAFKKICRKFPKEAQYVVPLAYKKRMLMTMNLRALHHFITLRSGREGHISYRKVAWAMHDEIARVHPELARYIRVDRSEGASR
ncbi:MAG: FAD-dependent thymidylate synthase, partial [Candidatus Aenigmatarchaeota archaeon]